MKARFVSSTRHGTANTPLDSKSSGYSFRCVDPPYPQAVQRMLSGRRRKHILIHIMIVLSVIVLAMSSMTTKAGPLRDRNRFNVKADGFWMKGRCFKPGKATFLTGGAAKAFGGLNWKDVGCVVKNRKGKRRPKKRRADVLIRMTIYAKNERGVVYPAISLSKRCNHSKRCSLGANESRNEIIGGSLKFGGGRRTKPGGPLTTRRPGVLDEFGGRDAISGIRACIMGRKNQPNRLTTVFPVNVGQTGTRAGRPHCPKPGKFAFELPAR